MRNLLLAASTLALTTFSAVQFASAAATIPDNQARVNTLSGYATAATRDVNASVDARAQASRPTRVQFFETPASHR